MKFSLIMATLGRKNEVGKFLQSINDCNYDNEKIEIIIVDQNKEQILSDIISRFDSILHIKHIRSKEKGLARNRNIGLKHASGDIVAFPDDDCEYLVDTLDKVSTLFELTNADLLMGRIVERDGSDSLRKWPKETIKINKNNFYEKCSSVTMFLKSKSAKINFNDRLGVGEYFGACEDATLIYENCKLRLKVIYEPEIQVYHPHYSSNTNMSNQKIESYGLGFGAMVKSNFDFPMSMLFVKAEGYHFLKAAIYLCTFKNENSKRSWVAFKSRIKGFLEYK